MWLTACAAAFLAGLYAMLLTGVPPWLAALVSSIVNVAKVRGAPWLTALAISLLRMLLTIVLSADNSAFWEESC